MIISSCQLEFSKAEDDSFSLTRRLSATEDRILSSSHQGFPLWEFSPLLCLVPSCSPHVMTWARARFSSHRCTDPTLLNEGDKKSMRVISLLPKTGSRLDRLTWYRAIRLQLTHTGTFITASHQHSGKLMNNAFPSDFLPYLLARGNIDFKKSLHSWGVVVTFI